MTNSFSKLNSTVRSPQSQQRVALGPNNPNISSVARSAMNAVNPEERQPTTPPQPHFGIKDGLVYRVGHTDLDEVEKCGGGIKYAKKMGDKAREKAKRTLGTNPSDMKHIPKDMSSEQRRLQKRRHQNNKSAKAGKHAIYTYTKTLEEVCVAIKVRESTASNQLLEIEKENEEKEAANAWLETHLRQ